MTRRKQRAEYGDMLKEYIDELNKQELYAPTSVQDYLGGVVANAYQSAFGSYADRHPGEVIPPAVQANLRRQAQAQPYNPGFLLDAQFKVGTEDFTFGQAFPALAGALKDVHTIGGAQDILFRSSLPGFMYAAKQGALNKKQDFANTMSALAAGFAEAVPNYDKSKASFAAYSQVRAYSSAKTYMNDEKEFSAGRGLSLEGMMTQEGDINGVLSAVTGDTGGAMPLSPFYGQSMNVAGVSPEVLGRMQDLYGGGPRRWQPNAIDPSSPGAMAGVSPEVLSRTLGSLSQGDLYNMADHVEAGGQIVLSDAGRQFALKGNYAPQPEFDVPDESWSMKLARRMDAWTGTEVNSGGFATSFSKYTVPRSYTGPLINPEGFASGNFFPEGMAARNFDEYRKVRISRKDVEAYSQIKGAIGPLQSEEAYSLPRGMVGPLPANQQASMDLFESALNGDRSFAVPQSYVGSLINPGGFATGNVFPDNRPQNKWGNNRRVTISAEDVAAYSRAKEMIGPLPAQQQAYMDAFGGAVDEIQGMLSGEGATYFGQSNAIRREAYLANAEAMPTNAHYDRDTERGAWLREEDPTYYGYGGPIPGLDSDASYALAQNGYLGTVRSAQSPASPSVAAMKEALASNMHPDMGEIVDPRQNELSGGILPVINGPKVRGREGIMQARMDALRSRNPNLYARAKYIGTNPADMASSVAQVAANYQADIRYTPGKEADFAKAYVELSGSNPEAAQAISALFPDEEEQLTTLTAMERQAQRRPEMGHRVAIPGGGHAQARSSVSRRVRGGEDWNIDQMPSAAYDAATPISVRRAGPNGGGGSGAGNNGGNEPPEEPPFDPFFAQPPEDDDDNTPAPNRMNGMSGSRPDFVANFAARQAQAGQRASARLTNGSNQRIPGMLNSGDLLYTYRGSNTAGDRRYGQFRTPFDQTVAGYDNPLYGRGYVSYGNDGSTNRSIVNPDSGEMTFSNNEILTANGMVEGTVSKALGSPLPLDPADAMATIKQRLYSGLKSEIDSAVKNMEHQTGDRVGSQEWGKRLSDLANTISDGAFKTAENIVKTAVTDQAGVSPNNDAVNTIKKGAIKVRSADEVRQIMQTNPEVAEAIRGTGMTPEVLASLPAGSEQILSGGGSSYMFGGEGGGYSGGGFGGGRGMGRVGQIAYGAYMMSQLWRMGTGGIMQESEQYGKLLSGVGSLGLYGSTVPITATEAGYSARQGVTNDYIGRTNYQNFGGFMDLGYLMSGSGDAAGRMYSSARMGGGIAMAGLAAPTLVGGLLSAAGGVGEVAGGSAMMGIAGALPVAGAVLGGGLLAGTIGMEMWNAAHPDANPVTWGSIPKAIERDMAMSSATKRYIEQKGGISQGDYKRAQQYGHMYGAQTVDADQSKVIDPSTISTEDLMKVMTPQELFASGFSTYGKDVDRVMAIASKIKGGTGESDEQIATTMSTMQRRLGKLPDDKRVVDFALEAQRSGRSSTQMTSEADTYASNLGYIPGTPEYNNAFFAYGATGLGEGERDRMSRTGQRSAGLASQISSFFNDPYAGGNIVRDLGISNNVQMSNSQKMLSAWAGVYGAPDEGRGRFLSSIGMNTTPFNASMMGDFIQTAGQFGMDGGQAGYVASQMSNFSPMQTQYMNAALSGDLRGLSYLSQKMGVSGNSFYDMSGRSNFNVNGGAYLSAINNWAGMVNLPQQTAASFLGTSNQQIIGAFTQNGTQGLEALGRQYSYEASMASSGVALKGIALQEQYNWGSGSWNAPSAGSAWGLADAQRALGYQSQQADFATQQQRMTLSNDYQIANENIQGQRMNASQGYNLWQLDFGRAQSLIQRGQTQVQWQYEDTQRSLSNQWNMEDINEQIRYSTGRERRVLLRQKSRMVTEQNLQEEEVDTSRDNQKQAWAAEDERYKKNREYQVEMAKLDRQSYDLNKKQREEFFALDSKDFERKKKEYEENFKLDTEQQELQRKFQYDQLQLQKESAGIQAWAAQKQKELNDAMVKAEQNNEKYIGAIEMLNKYDKVPAILKAVNDMLAGTSNVHTDAISALTQFIKIMGSVTASQAATLMKIWENQ